jgi:hypothetical protein
MHNDLMQGRVSVTLMAVCMALTLASSPAQAAPKPVKVLKTWTGRVPLVVPPPLQSSVASAAQLQQIWALCQVKGDVPVIDFDKRLVLLAVRRGTTVQFNNLKIDGGNLMTNVVVTPDMPSHMTCALALVDRAGATKVNGLPLGQ